MSWLYSQALVAEYLAENSSAGEPSVPLSKTPTPQAYSSPDRMTEFSRLSRFGMTFAPLTDDLGADVLTSFLAAFPARTSALPEKVQASPESAPASGPTWRASLAKFDPDSRSWKTVQLCLLGDSELSSVTWPRSGMTADGQCWALPMSALRIKGTGSGLWPTPTAHNAKEGGFQSEHDRNTPTLAAQAGGALNPTWVEWLMGWPLGWTDLKPLETDKSQPARQPHGESSQAIAR